MPYTISFDELAKIVPQVRTIIASFPQVTTVASEHGRPDDGTDATGFFNAEFFVGLKPYSQWTGPIHTKSQLTAAINDKLQSFPGITLNYTQPAEDAVDEAETGLKSALAVKVFGPDLDTLERKGKAIKAVLSKVRGIRDVTLVQELGQPSLAIRHRSLQDRPLRDQCRRHQRPHPDRHWRRRRDPGRPAGERIRSRRPAQREISRRPGRDRQHPRRDPGRPAYSVEGARRHLRRQWRIVHLPREQQPLHRRAILGRGPRSCGRGGGRDAASFGQGAIAAGLPGSTGAANMANTLPLVPS